MVTWIFCFRRMYFLHCQDIIVTNGFHWLPMLLYHLCWSPRFVVSVSFMALFKFVRKGPRVYDHAVIISFWDFGSLL